jgi:hypothetical protein
MQAPETQSTSNGLALFAFLVKMFAEAKRLWGKILVKKERRPKKRE